MDLIKIDRQVLTEIEKQWKEYFYQNDFDYFSNGYIEQLDAINHHLCSSNRTDIESRRIFYVLVSQSKYLSVLHVEVVDTKEKYCKITAIRTHPEYDSRNNYQGDHEIKRIAKTWDIFESIIKLKINYLFNEVRYSSIKILTNTQLNKFFIHTLMAYNSENGKYKNKIVLEYISVSSYNSWLEIRRN